METFIVVILDESGSMSDQIADVVGGYNEFIREQQKLTKEEAKDKVNISLLKFNSQCNWIYRGIDLDSVRVLNQNDYKPSQSTALFDAVAEGINYADVELKKSTENDCGNKRVLVVIMTDGENNSSTKTTADEVRRLISDREERGNWTFTYIGENPDKWIKLSGTRDVGNIIPQIEGQSRRNFKMLSAGVTSYRSSTLTQPRAIMQMQQEEMGYLPRDQMKTIPLPRQPYHYPPIPIGTLDRDIANILARVLEDNLPPTLPLQPPVEPPTSQSPPTKRKK